MQMGFVQVVSSPFLFCIKKRGHWSCKINIGSEFTHFSAVGAKMKFHSPLTETTKTHVSKPDKSDGNYLHGWIHKRTAERRSAALQSVNSQMVLNIVFTSTATGTRNFSNVLVLIRPVGCSELINWTSTLHFSSSCIKPRSLKPTSCRCFTFKAFRNLKGVVFLLPSRL